jgi:hypothetical protein
MFQRQAFRPFSKFMGAPNGQEKVQLALRLLDRQEFLKRLRMREVQSTSARQQKLSTHRRHGVKINGP